MCLDILKDQWSRAVRLKTALPSVQALLSAPELRDPQDALVARQTFIDTARSWTENFARVSSLGVEEKMKRLVEMGFADDLVRSSLAAIGGDEG
ncbi:hypothetical protein Goklo_019508 [Gossypium klotzschianum]|uniref:UBA domain-containing protein n=1 Tax=Gossypium klotzschianum TaxID=34286 RepID=A0A7J8UP42_9ROSI|nr:hypothetical protein [Gossypium klotzschianum]